MAIPNAKTEGGGDKILSPVYDNGGTNAFGLFSARKTRTVNSETYVELDVYSTSGSLENGWKATTGSTAIALSSTSIPCQGAIVKASSANAGTLYVGKSDVTANDTESTGGYPLEPGESVGVPCRNVNEVFIRGTTGDKAAWIASAD